MNARSLVAACLAVVAVAGCSSSSGGAPSPYIDGFNPPPVAAGYTRYVTPVIHDIAPGTDVLYCQWVAAPSTDAQDVLDVTGLQSAHGHHVILYSTTEAQPLGESHSCTTNDMLYVGYLGAVGNEGTAGGKLPEGVAFRMKPGQYIMANTHFINAGTEPIDGQAVIDVKWEAASSTRQLASLFVDIGTSFTIPANALYTLDERCTLQSDLSVLMVGNHMHQYGQSVYSEMIHSDGTTDSLRNDTTWSAEEEFNPTFTTYPLAQPYVMHSGDVIHTSCTWQNTIPSPLTFPDEMCASFAYYLVPAGSSGDEINCEDGQWPTSN
jgi:hypothetical protein